MTPAKSYRDRLPARAGFPIRRPSIDPAPRRVSRFQAVVNALFQRGQGA